MSDEIRDELRRYRRFDAAILAAKFAIRHNMPAAYERASKQMREN